jgi:hypothetical protein
MPVAASSCMVGSCLVCSVDSFREALALVCEMTALLLIKDLSAWVRDGTDGVIG